MGRHSPAPERGRVGGQSEQRERQRLQVIQAQEQIADRPPAAVGQPPLGQMKRPVMQYMAALTEAFQVGKPVVGGVAVEMRRGEHDAGQADVHRLDQVRPARRTSALTRIDPGLLV